MTDRLRIGLGSVVALLCLLLLAVSGSAETPVAAEMGKPLRGVALVIGQSKYEHLLAQSISIHSYRQQTP